MQKPERAALIATGDYHINSTIGLCPPAINLDDGGTYRASPGQKWLWDYWLRTWEEIKTATVGERVITLLNGDLVDFDIKRRGSPQYITGNEATVIDLAGKIIEPISEMSDGMIFTRGTPAHVGSAAVYEEIVADDYDNTIRAENSASWYHVRPTVSGVRFDIAHHTGGGGRLPWTGPNVANKIAAKAIMEYTEIGERCPHLVIRSHIHRSYDSGDNFDQTRAITLPAWQLATEYVYRIGAENSAAHVGAVVIFCDEGRYEIRKWVMKFKPRRVWALTV